MHRTAWLWLSVLAALGPLACATPGAAARSSAPTATAEHVALPSVDAAGGALWVGAHPWTEHRRAWTLPTEAPCAVRVSSLDGGSGFEVRLWSGSREWRGELDALRRPRGPLRRIAPSPAPVARLEPPVTPGL